MAKVSKILIVDDSLLVRQSLNEIFSADPELEVVGMASDPYEAAQELKRLVPDVITLDIEMPKMNGITFLKKLMNQHPIPVVIISTLTQEGSKGAVKALEYGAVDVVGKPKVNTRDLLHQDAMELCRKIKAAARSNVNAIMAQRKFMSTFNVPKPEVQRQTYDYTHTVIAMGASTGGTEALRTILKQMPQDCPGIVIVQHMPEVFTKQFADRLNMECQISVKEATNGDAVVKGQALIAPGNMHMLLKKQATNYYVEVKAGPLVNRHMPSVDVLFKSTARYARGHAVGVILTGMGKDGAQGMFEMKNEGAYTIAQDESTSVVFGMPKEAIKLGTVDEVLPLHRIAEAMLKQVKLN